LPPDNNTSWELKKYLLEFNLPVSRHTGKLIGEDLVATIRKFQLENKVSMFSWLLFTITDVEDTLLALGGVSPRKTHF